MNIQRELEKLIEKLNEPVEPLDLGEVIELLESHISWDHGSWPVYFDWGSVYPTGNIYSYRGDYAQCCLSFTGEYGHITVAKLLNDLNCALGTNMSGWKGGLYTVHYDCELYVACPGVVSNTRITGSHIDFEHVILETIQLKS